MTSHVPNPDRSPPLQVNSKHLIAAVPCYQTVRAWRWPDGIACPSCQSKQVMQRGFEDTALARQRYACHDGHTRFDALTDTMFAGPHPPRHVWMVCVYCMGLHVSNEPMAQAWAVHDRAVQPMTTQRREGSVKKSPASSCQPRWSATKPLGLPAIQGNLRW